MQPSPPHASPSGWRFLDDQSLLSHCRFDLFRGSGPGGQKRNKTSNSVRLTHRPTGIAVLCDQTRSQAENKRLAMRNLRLRLAIELREPVDVRTFSPPDWFLSIRTPARIQASHRHPLYAPAVGLVLDLLKVLDANPAKVAAMLGVSTTAVIRLLENDPAIWTAANRLRASAGLPPLTPRK